MTSVYTVCTVGIYCMYCVYSRYILYILLSTCAAPVCCCNEVRGQTDVSDVNSCSRSKQQSQITLLTHTHTLDPDSNMISSVHTHTECTHTRYTLRTLIGPCSQVRLVMMS